MEQLGVEASEEPKHSLDKDKDHLEDRDQGGQRTQDSDEELAPAGPGKKIQRKFFKKSFF